MYRPLRVFLGFIALIVLFDVAVLGALISPWFFTGITIALPLIVWAWMPVSKDVKTGDEGWIIGEGLDLENPRKPRRQKVVLQDKVLKLGFLGLGAPGSGKTVSLAVGLIYYYSVQFFERTGKRIGWGYMEGKGDKEIYQYAVALDSAPDLFFSSELHSTDEMNLFQGEAKDVLDIWSRILVPASTNEFYANEQKRVLKITIPLLKTLGKAMDVEVSLRDLYVLLSKPDSAIKIMALARAHNLPSTMINEADDYFKEDFSERQNTIRGLLNKLFNFVSGETNDRINSYNPKINLADAVREGKRIYFHLPLTEYAKDIAYAVCEGFAAIARDRQNYDNVRQLWPMIFDDWGGFFYDGFSKATARIRSANMPANFMFQSKGQMDEIDPTFAVQIDDTVSTKIFLRIMGDDTRNWASRMAGTFDDVSYSISDRKDDSADMQSLGSRDTPRVKPEEFRGLHDGEAIISTTFKQDAGQVVSMTLKARFPLLQGKVDPATVEWPECEKLSPGVGLGLWDMYMGSDQLVEPTAAPFSKKATPESNDIAEAQSSDQTEDTDANEPTEVEVKTSTKEDFSDEISLELSEDEDVW